MIKLHSFPPMELWGIVRKYNVVSSLKGTTLRKGSPLVARDKSVTQVAICTRHKGVPCVLKARYDLENVTPLQQLSN